MPSGLAISIHTQGTSQGPSSRSSAFAIYVCEISHELRPHFKTARQEAGGAQTLLSRLGWDSDSLKPQASLTCRSCSRKHLRPEPRSLNPSPDEVWGQLPMRPGEAFPLEPALLNFPRASFAGRSTCPREQLLLGCEFPCVIFLFCQTFAVLLTSALLGGCDCPCTELDKVKHSRSRCWMNSLS